MEKLHEIAKEYFDADKKLESLYITDDGNVFYVEAKSFMDAHCKQNKTKPNLVKREDLKQKKSESKTVAKKPEPKEAPKENSDKKEVKTEDKS